MTIKWARGKKCATREKGSRSEPCGEWKTGRMTTVFHFIISNGFWYMCVSNIKSDNFFYRGWECQPCSWYLFRSTCHSSDALFNRIKTETFADTKFFVPNRIESKTINKKVTDLMNRLPVHTNKMCGRPFSRNRKKRILTEKKHVDFVNNVNKMHEEKMLSLKTSGVAL